MRRTLIRILVLCIITVCWPGLTFAHGIVAGGARVVEVQAGAYPLRVEITVPTGAPALMTVKVWPQRDFVGSATITVTAFQRDTQARIAQTIRIPAGPRTISVADLMIPEVGAWDVQIAVADSTHGSGESHIPVTIYPATFPPLTIVLFASVLVLALVLFGSTLWPQPVRWYAIIQPHLITAALSVSLVIGGMMVWPDLRVEFPQPDTTSRPYMTMDVSTTRDAARAVDVLRLHLFDGSTGLPADDVVPHHQALLHLVLIDPVSQTFLHLHPARIAPGTFVVDLPEIVRGTYDVAVELERVNSGSQVLHRMLTLGTVAGGTALVPAALPAQVSLTPGITATVHSKTPPVAGHPVEIAVDITAPNGSAPILDYWLGMRGHMILRNSDGAIFGHVHAVGTMNDAFQPVSDAGNSVSFVYAFPKPDTYHLWIQVMVAGVLHTIPVQVVVPA